MDGVDVVDDAAYVFDEVESIQLVSVVGGVALKADEGSVKDGFLDEDEDDNDDEDECECNDFGEA